MEGEHVLDFLKAMQKGLETQMAEMLAGQARMEAEMDAWLTEMKKCRREAMACQQTMEANPETMMARQETTEACQEVKELSPEEMESEVERREVPTEEAAVKSSRTMKKRHGPAYGCRATWEAKGTDPKRLWIPGVVGCRLQEGVTPCCSGMAQEVRFQEDSDPGKLWTTASIGRRQNKDDDPPCKSDTAREKRRQENSDQIQSDTRNFEKTDIREEASAKSRTQKWDKEPRSETAATKPKGVHQDLQEDHWTGDRKANCQISCCIT
jgi:hypothetical protein